jgi:hypothetical protein
VREQHGAHVEEDGEGRIHLDQVDIRSGAVEDPRGLVEEESGVGTGVTPELCDEAQRDYEVAAHEEDRPPLERGRA